MPFKKPEKYEYPQLMRLPLPARISILLCQSHGYHRVGGFDLDTGLAWACYELYGRMFHVHIDSGEVAYQRTYAEVRGFHCGRAVVKDEAGNWSFHIKPNGKPAYRRRFYSVGHFFDGLADVRDKTGAFHIYGDGKAAYERKFKSVGRFRYGTATAEDKTGAFHITPAGKNIYKERFISVGEFDEHGQAEVEALVLPDGTKTTQVVKVHINRYGPLLNLKDAVLLPPTLGSQSLFPRGG